MELRTARDGVLRGALAVALAGCGNSNEPIARRDAARTDVGDAGMSVDVTVTPGDVVSLDTAVGVDASGGPDADAAGDGGGRDVGAVDAAAETSVDARADVSVADVGCPLGLIACAGRCVDGTSDPTNCGGCGLRCAGGPNGAAACVAGSCTLACAAGFANCDGLLANGCEVDTRTARDHCGACGAACVFANASAACVAGACGIAGCAPGFGDCDRVAANGCEASLTTAERCGACGRTCTVASPVCDGAAGACVSGCRAGEIRCGDACVNAGTDAMNCGACGVRCAIPNGLARCAAGACAVGSCAEGFGDCDGSPTNGCEADLRTDPANCGRCGSRPSEVCNGVDDTCDGVVDEGFRASGIGTTYGALQGFHAPCDGAGQRIGPDCNAAIHRFCSARGCTNSGFGPVENSGGNASVVCVQGSVITTSYTTLRTFHAPCDGAGQRIGPDCNAAINRFCADRGFVAGYGPVENSGDTAIVTCVRAPSARTYMTTYTILRGLHPGCDGTGQRLGPECNAAINRFCGARGHVGGFGPLENSGDAALVACVTP
jgi:hypothetical protein